MRDRLIGYVASIEADCFSVEEISQRFIGRVGISQRPCRHVEPADEVFIQLSFKSEAHPQPPSIAIKTCRAVLKDTVITYPNISPETKSTYDVLQRTQPLLPFLG